jgi:HEPN domain-containing protein
LAVELYLKSRLLLVIHDDDLEVSHNIVGLYNALKARFKPSKNLTEYMARSRKYFNEARYPYVGDTSIYTREFADEFIDIVEAVKSYIDNECVATEEDLKKKFTKEK